MMRSIRVGRTLIGVACSIIWAVASMQIAEAASATAGAQTWADNCDRCHNMRDPRDFDAEQWGVIVTHMRILAGLTGGEARDVLEFLRKSAAPAPGATAVNESVTTASSAAGTADGKQIYEGTCIACHGADGKGTVPGAPNFTAGDGPLSKSDSVLFDNVKNGFQSPGSPLAMPAKGGDARLGDQDIRAVLAYIRRAFGARTVR